ncbi:hypothetical protein [Embleya sp. NPDC059237]|uniref:hypothetical protein n=1 Tax=Embleya sp. NPDC059237 TaxID=3346784 RepID=UPI00367D1C1B
MKDAIRKDVRTLSGAQATTWRPIAARHGISTFSCKYLYTTGLLREHMSVSGLAFRNKVYLGSVFAALIAAELVGHCVEPATTSAGLRLKNGLHYLEATRPAADGEYVPPAKELVDLRNFVAHGAFAAGKKGASMTTETTTYLLHRLALAADKLWSDTKIHKSFKESAITPLFLKDEEECIYVAEMLGRIESGRTPGQDIDHQDAWRQPSNGATNVPLFPGSSGPTGTA